MMRKINNKGQTGGLITSLVFGIASLVIGIIIAFVIVSTLSDADLLTSGRTTDSFTNETGFINSTGYTLVGGQGTLFAPGTFSITIVTNGSATGGETITAANFTVNSAGVVTNLTADTYGTANFTYTVANKTNVEISQSDLSNNFTAGIDNVSSKLPTVLLIAAIILILGVLAILVGVWQRMRMGGGTSL